MSAPKQKLKNEDFTIVPGKNTGTLKISAAACKCGKTKCDYVATSATAVSGVDLGGDYAGKQLELPATSYAESAPGAAALQQDLNVLLDGLADSVTVEFTGGHLVITVTGSIIQLTGLNDDAVSFTVSNCRGEGDNGTAPDTIED